MSDAELEDESEPLEGEVIEAPDVVKGSRAWLEGFPLVQVLGLSLPAVHRVQDGSTLADGEGDRRCRLIRPDGRRCGAPRLDVYGVCLVHAGGGGMHDREALANMSRKGHAVKLARKQRRELLGIGSRRAASPRQIARVQAFERASELATALVGAPLDDPSLGTIERQQAVIRALDATFPLASTSVEVSLPADADGAAAMSWSDMRQLAARLLDDGSQV